MPETTERLSHGEPTFFVHKKVFAMYAGNHHNDGKIAVWLPVPQGLKSVLIEGSPGRYFNPPYVGVRGWVGIELEQIGDSDLTLHLREAWSLVAPRRMTAALRAETGQSPATAE